MKTKIKNKKKLLEYLQQSTPDVNYHSFCGNCAFYYNTCDVNGCIDIYECNLFCESLKARYNKDTDEDMVIRCSQCLECFEVENEN